MAKDFISDQEMMNLERAGHAVRPKSAAPDFISDEEMARISKESKPDVIDLKGAGQAALESYGNAATLGYLPHLQALASKLTPDRNRDVNEKLKAQGFSISEPESNYVSARDENIRRQLAQKEEFPKASTLGTVAGIGAGALLLPGGAALKTAGLPVKEAMKLAAIQGGKMGAALGAVSNPGDQEGEISPFQIGDRLKGAALGGAIGAGSSAAIEGIGPLAKAVGQWFRAKANEKAVAALGGGKRAVDKLRSSGQDQALGETLLEENAIPVLGTPGRIAKRVEPLKEKSGEELGALIDSVDSNQVRYTPIKIKKSNHPVVQEEILFTPVRFDENPARRFATWLKDEDTPPRLVRGETQPIQRELRGPTQYEVIKGRTKLAPGSSTSVSGPQVAKGLLKSPEYLAAKGVPGLESYVSAVESAADAIAKKGQMTLREAQTLRKGIDKSVNFNKGPDSRGAQAALYEARTGVRDAMNDAVNSFQGNEANALKAANTKYSNYEKALEMLDDRLSRDAANRSVSLTDTIAAGAGMAAGKPSLGLALGALNKAGRAFGSSIQARSAQGISQALSKVPAFAELAQRNPLVAQVLVNRLTQTPTFSPEAEGILNDQNILGIIKQNPDLLEGIQDPTLKSRISERLGIKQRAPSAIQGGR